MKLCKIAVPILCVVIGSPLFAAADLSRYREFQFGMSLREAARQAGADPSEVALIHQRPALIQELEWHPRFQGAPQEPVSQGLLSFYNGQLYRMVVIYDPYRIEGLTSEDMIASISAIYGTAAKPGVRIPYHSNYGEVAAVLARWESPEYSYNLIRTGNDSGFGMILFSKRLEALALEAIAEAVRLDAQEAPQREANNRAKQKEEARVALEATRAANKSTFRP